MKVEEITYTDTQLQYRLDSDVFQIHRVLHHGYKNLEAYEEAIGIMDERRKHDDYLLFGWNPASYF